MLIVPMNRAGHGHPLILGDYSTPTWVQFLPSGTFFAQGILPLSTVVINRRITTKAYYEVHYITPGVSQCGFGRVPAEFSDGGGCGDVPGTYACDPYRQARWNMGSTNYALGRLSNTVGDVLGCAVDPEKRLIEFFRNGVPLGVAFVNVEGPLYPMISVQQLTFVFVNMGQYPFRYPIQGYGPVIMPEYGLYSAINTCLPQVMSGLSLEILRNLPLMFQLELAVLCAVTSHEIPLYLLHDNAAQIANMIKEGRPLTNVLATGKYDAELERNYIQDLATTPFDQWHAKGIHPILTPRMRNGALALITEPALAARFLEMPPIAEALVRCMSCRSIPDSQLDLESVLVNVDRVTTIEVAQAILGYHIGQNAAWPRSVAPEAAALTELHKASILDLAVLFMRWFDAAPTLASEFFTVLADRAVSISKANSVLALSLRESFPISAAASLCLLVGSASPVRSPDLNWLEVLSSHFSLPEGVFVGGVKSNVLKYATDMHQIPSPLPVQLPLGEVPLRAQPLIGSFIRRLTEINEVTDRDPEFIKTMLFLFCSSAPSQSLLGQHLATVLQQQEQPFRSLVRGASGDINFTHPVYATKQAALSIISFINTNTELLLTVFEMISASIVDSIAVSERGRPLDEVGQEWPIARERGGEADSRPRLAIPWQRLLWVPSSFLIAASQHIARFQNTLTTENVPVNLARLLTYALQLDAVPLHFRQSIIVSLLSLESMLRGNSAKSITREATVGVVSFLARPVSGELTVGPLLSESVLLASNMIVSMIPRELGRDVIRRQLAMVPQARALIDPDGAFGSTVRSLSWFNRVLLTLLECANSAYDNSFSNESENPQIQQRTTSMAVMFTETIFAWGMIRLSVLGRAGRIPEDDTREGQLGDIPERAPVRELVTLIAAVVRRLPGLTRQFGIQANKINTKIMLVYFLTHTLIAFVGPNEAARLLSRAAAPDDAKYYAYFAQLTYAYESNTETDTPQSGTVGQCWLRDQLSEATVKEVDHLLLSVPVGMLVPTPLAPLGDDDSESETEVWSTVIKRVLLRVAVQCGVVSQDQVTEEEACPICYTNRATVCMEPCGHRVCPDCLDQFQAQGIFTCCVCQQPVEGTHILENEQQIYIILLFSGPSGE